MKHGFVKVAAITPKIKVADPEYNSEAICCAIDEAEKNGAKILVFPELCITGYTCGDLFLQELLLESAKQQLIKIAGHTEKKDLLAFVGLPLEYNGKLYNVAAALAGGQIIGLVPKTFLPIHNEFYEGRHFTKGMEEPVPVVLDGEHIAPMGTRILFGCRQMPALKIGVEICEDLWVPSPPGIRHAMAGATLLVNLSASDETTGKDLYRKSLVVGQSARLVCGYIYSSAGDGESTQDLVYSGHNLIAENGVLLSESERFASGAVYSELDIARMNEERRRLTTFDVSDQPYMGVDFNLKETETVLSRFVDPSPFVPSGRHDREKRCEEILAIQALGLKKRLEHTGSKSVVVGISGGLDSTLALLVAVRAFDSLGRDRSDIIAVTMPGFGTTDRTYDNAVALVKSLGAQLIEINISEAVRLHFRDIGHDENIHDVTYENSQARERTQILMDLANQKGGLVVGTGDMSELALGWATYNGDHMSMYAVNASVPKTLVRYLVLYYADRCGDEILENILYDILDTPVSPELLPPKNGDIAQETESIVGPYELHDFFLYYLMRFGFAPKKIYRLALYAFDGRYTADIILQWLKVFYRRFFTQQYKRSCIPDGPKVGTIALSPRGDLRMPSDASAKLWLDQLEHIDAEEPKQEKSILNGDWTQFAVQFEPLP